MRIRLALPLAAALMLPLCGACSSNEEDPRPATDAVGKSVEWVKKHHDGSLAVYSLSRELSVGDERYEPTEDPLWTVVAACSNSGALDDDQASVGVISSKQVTEVVLRDAREGKYLKQIVQNCEE